ncbi:MAG: hypothetical protein N3A66_11035, partial [Planctomycetota bacterium]|nr:hypothetical protein [Planctomycetota bacterium]
VQAQVFPSAAKYCGLPSDRRPRSYQSVMDLLSENRKKKILAAGLSIANIILSPSARHER